MFQEHMGDKEGFLIVRIVINWITWDIEERCLLQSSLSQPEEVAFQQTLWHPWGLDNGYSLDCKNDINLRKMTSAAKMKTKAMRETWSRGHEEPCRGTSRHQGRWARWAQSSGRRRPPRSRTWGQWWSSKSSWLWRSGSDNDQPFPVHHDVSLEILHRNCEVVSGLVVNNIPESKHACKCMSVKNDNFDFSVCFFLVIVEVSLPDDSAELDVFLNVLLVPAAFQVVK